MATPPIRDFRDCLDFLYARNQFAMKLGLDNMRRLLGRLGDPDHGQFFVHVAGTNGKGSVCANLARLLPALGYRRIGLYTSPHLVSFRERIRVDGEPIPRDWVVSWLREAAPHILELGSTYFECATAMAMDYFRAAGCGAAVLETGLGGRLDATNVVQPAITVITSISLDHTGILGDTVEAIWGEKLGILKPGAPVVVDETRPALLAELEARAGRLGCPIRNLATMGMADHPDGSWEYSGGRGTCRFPADLRREGHQVRNARLSLLALETLAGGVLPPCPELEAALRQAPLPGRTQFLTAPGQLPLLLDGAHNPGGMEALSAHIRQAYPGWKITVLFAIMADKDVERVWDILAGFAHRILFITLAGHARALTFPDLTRLLDRLPPGHPPVEEFALDQGKVARFLAHPGSPASDRELVVACGSLYFLGALIPLLVDLYPGLEMFRQFTGES